MKTHRFAKTALAAAALAALLGCLVLAPTPALAGKKKKGEVIDINKLVWPPSPAPTRLRFLAEYHGEDVKGIKKQGILERLAGVQDLEAKSMLVKPESIAIDSRGRAFVTDTILKLVFVFDAEHKTLEYRGDKPPASFKLPMGVAIDAQDRLFVSDADHHNITAFDPDGNVLDSFGEKELERPIGMAVDPELRRLYVADVKARMVAQFNLDTFEFERWIGKSAAEKMEPQDYDKALSSPTSLALNPDGLLYVVDTFTNRVVVFDSDGEFVRQFGETGQGAGKFMRPRGIAFDPDGHVYVSDVYFNFFQIFTEDGKPLMPVGKTGVTPGSFRIPIALAFDKLNRLFVVDQYNARIQIFRYIPDAEVPAQPAAAQTASASKEKEPKK